MMNKISKARTTATFRTLCCLTLCLVSTTFRFFLQTDRLLASLELEQQDPSLDAPWDAPSSFQSLVLQSKQQSSNNDDSFSACILWMDDNHRLEEWLAYHYYLLKLRYVVINIDPFSMTSPQAIIDRWNSSNLNMTIVVMHDREYVQNFDQEMQAIQDARNSSSSKDRDYRHGKQKTNYHRARQTQFYRACSKHLVEQNRSWTSYHDTDEFLSFAHKHNETDIAQQGKRKMQQPGYVLDALNEIQAQVPSEAFKNDTGLSCLVIPRTLFVATEWSNHNTTTNNDNQDLLRKFETLRFRYVQDKRDGAPKSLIDLSQTNPQLFLRDEWHQEPEMKGKPHKWRTHLPMSKLCDKERSHRLESIDTLLKDEHFVMHHYLGSFESYSFRNDARQGGLRSYEIWKERSNDTKGDYSDVILPWFQGFVDMVGEETAMNLLQDAGRFPEDYNRETRMQEFKSTYDFGKNKPNNGKKKKKRIKNRKKRGK